MKFKNIIKLNVLCVPLFFVACNSGVEHIQRKLFVRQFPSESIDQIKIGHAIPEPVVLKNLRKNNFRNYSLYVREIEPDSFYLFRYFEYTGKSLKSDVEYIHKNEKTADWWNLKSVLLTDMNQWVEWEPVFYFAGSSSATNPTRHGWVIGIHKKDILAYTQLHAAPWPGVLERLDSSHIQNYSIFLGEIRKDMPILFSYLEYSGNDFDMDMQKMAKDKVTQLWWSYTDPLQYTLPSAEKGEHWSTAREIYHFE